jgi:phage terminase small subunit
MALTPKQAAFAREYAVDKNATQAAIRAGYSAATAKQQGARLLTNVDVRAEVERTLARSAQRVELTVASVTSKLLALSEKAEGMDGPSAINVSRQCVMDAAKLNGLVVESSEVVTRSPEERAARLAALKAERDRLARAH